MDDPDGSDERDVRESREARGVRRWRVDQAIRAGLTNPEAELFADSDQTCELLRRLKQKGASPEQIALIVC